MPSTVALIVAAGRGERAGSDLPKQYADIAGKPLLSWTLGAFHDHPAIDGVRVVIDPAWRDQYDRAVDGLDLGPPIDGGATRQASVAAGLEALTDHAPGNVLIHDAARPFVSANLIQRVVDALATDRAVLPGLAVPDTLKRCETGIVVATEPRDGLWAAQTPQGFHFDAILEAHRQATGQALTDDAAVAEAAGMTVRMIEGAVDNTKITTPDDLERARSSLGRREIRTGMGFDVHAFTDGAHVTLCGIDVPHTHGLAGNSDADVGLHVLIDAIFGALGTGDLGTHFPPNDTTWHGRPSSDLLAVAVAMMKERDARLINADITLICERPRLARHQPVMRERVASLLDAPLSRINVKVTSTDGLGFAGRGEGIAGSAVVTMDLPAP
ncbi:MAG: bifunctional 2-C-methyl-D-erythritol 4-phosphate cytidylyltransferase/2-C-methyl-D-erythritol 2,4-cyclodiphosphate synthase [Pseudomonadota bacterium]